MKESSRQRIIYIVGDLLATAVGVLLFNLFRFWRIFSGQQFTLESWSRDPHVIYGYLAFPILFLLIFAISGFYNHPLRKSRYEIVTNTAACGLFGSLVIYFTIMVNDPFTGRLLHYSILLALFVIFFVVVLFERLIIDSISKRAIAAGHNIDNIVVVGTAKSAARFVRRLERFNSRMGYRVVAIVDDDNVGSIIDGVAIISFDNLRQYIDNNDIKVFAVDADVDDVVNTVDTVNRLYQYGCKILLPIASYNSITARPRLVNVIGEPMVDITAVGITPFVANVKRISDVVVSSLGLILLSPLLLAIAICVKSGSPGRVFYTQMRVGRNGREFKIVKFRSMRADAEAHGPALSSEHDERITPFGKVMRKYRIDELPQLWNVFKGDMSLVGPRPEREFYLKQIMECEPAACTILKVRPGLTSLGMVKFGYASNLDDMCRRVKYDILYVESMSMMLDVKILFYTIITVFTGKGI